MQSNKILCEFAGSLRWANVAFRIIFKYDFFGSVGGDWREKITNLIIIIYITELL